MALVASTSGIAGTVTTYGVDPCEDDNASGIVLHADFMARD
jgi:hypothetical protein